MSIEEYTWRIVYNHGKEYIDEYADGVHARFNDALPEHMDSVHLIPAHPDAFTVVIPIPPFVKPHLFRRRRISAKTGKTSFRTCLWWENPDGSETYHWHYPEGKDRITHHD